jgi:hypothetical protein
MRSLHDLFTLPDVIGVLKSRRVGSAEQINAHRILVEKPALIEPGRLGEDGKVMLKQILKKWDVRVWAGFFWLGRGALVNTGMKLWVL